MQPETASFLEAKPTLHDVGTAQIAVRTFGNGRPLLLIHGWPLWGFTWRKVLPQLAKTHRCYVVDSPGAGDTVWSDDNDFSFTGQAKNYAKLLDVLGLSDLDVLAHDTGATIARALALQTGDRIKKLVLIGTEIPGHRPPWIELFQKTVILPGSTLSFQALLRSKTFIRSGMGFGETVTDHALLEGDFEDHIIRPLIADRRRMTGQIRYLKGIDWALVDRLAEDHKKITGKVLLLWGKDDTVFPVARAEPMVAQFKDCVGLETIPDAKLLVHEERPEEVARRSLAFLDAA